MASSSRSEETERFLNAWMRLRQIVQAANFNRFRRAGLSATQFMTLNIVPREGIALSSLARRLNLSPASVHQTVVSLEDRGLLRRKRSSKDSRKVEISATSEGERMQNAASIEFRNFIAALFLPMTRQQRQELLTGLEIMATNGERQQAASSAAPLKTKQRN